MAETVVLSGSSLNTYLRCGRQWELAYVQRIKRPPSLKMALGTAGHYAAEVDFTQKIESREDLPLDMVLDAFSDSFNKETVDSPEVPAKKETKPLMHASGIEAMKVWHKDIAPTIQPAMVEQPVQFMLSTSVRGGEETNIPWTGTVDLVDEDVLVRDWKFVGKKPDPRNGDYVLNMVGYAIGYRELTGGLENGVVLDHVVRTKTPYHFKVESATVKDESIIAFAGIAESVYNSIGAGSFPPTGLKSGACSWCGFKRECGYYQGPM